MINKNYSSDLVKIEILRLLELIAYEETHMYFNKYETHFFIKEFKDGKPYGLPSLFPYDTTNIHIDSINNLGTYEFIEKNGLVELKEGAVVKHKSFDPSLKEMRWFIDTVK